ncbi:MAG: ornithine carbamoyltransferase, partial [Lachnospiraceae bacterium]|nr:ornithine carbamoyltransferase [Lachnospiraceae bacterium]
VGCAKAGIDFVDVCPQELSPDPAIVAKARECAARHGSTVTVSHDPATGVRGANVLYTDVWVSMGEPDSVWEERINALLPYQVNAKAMANAKPEAVFMHCLPAFHDLNTGIGRQIHDKFGLDAMEVTDEVFESKQSVVFDEAENRMHTIKAVMDLTL